MTREAAAPAGTVTYTLHRAATPGTYLYHSGTQPDLQVEMGLVGAIIVRPVGLRPDAAAGLRPRRHRVRPRVPVPADRDGPEHPRAGRARQTRRGRTDDAGDYFPNYWFINGRNAPDTMADGRRPVAADPAVQLPCRMMHPGERVLMRVVGAGRDLHPFHHHGNHARVIARDGRLLAERARARARTSSHEVFTIQSVPGRDRRRDLHVDRRGARLGHLRRPATRLAHAARPGRDCADGFDDATSEYCADHGKPFPVDAARAPEPHLRRRSTAAARSWAPLGTLPPGRAA